MGDTDLRRHQCHVTEHLLLAKDWSWRLCAIRPLDDPEAAELCGTSPKSVVIATVGRIHLAISLLCRLSLTFTDLWPPHARETVCRDQHRHQRVP